MTDHDNYTYSSPQNGSFKRPVPDRKKRQLYPVRGAKVHWVYTVEQVCALYNVHSNTVSNWMNYGLQAIDEAKPRLFRGSELNRFHTARRERARKTLKPGELYCAKCSGPRLPRPHTIRLEPSVVAFACVVASCSDCGARLYRMISEAESRDWTARLTHNPTSNAGHE